MARSTMGHSGPSWWMLLACFHIPIYLTIPTVTALSTDQLYTDIDSDYDITTEVDLLKRDNVSCPVPACACRRSSAGRIVTATCTSFNWGKQTFQGLISALEVENAPPSEEFFLASHSLASMGLKDVSSVRIVKSSLSALNETTFSGLDKLEEVDLSDNKIKFPHRNAFRNNTNLETLSLSGNPLGLFLFLLKDNEYLMDVPSLYKLDLSRCGIKMLKPTTFSRLRQLQNLKLSGNELEMIHPDTFQDLSYLENVDLSSNKLYQMNVDTFKRNNEMAVLNIKNNSLTELLRLAITNLEELDLSENNIMFINDTTLSGLPNLVTLNLSANKISRVDELAFVNNRRITKLDLSGNDIAGPLPRKLFARLEMLEELILSDNPTMGSLPDNGFEGSFTVLNSFDVSYCELSQLRVDHLKNMQQIEHLNLKGNKLTSLNPHVLAQLSKLRTLDLSKNDLRTLDERLFLRNPYLQSLYLSENPLAIISSNMLPASIRELDLGQCQLESLWTESATPERLNPNLTRLTHLNVYGNQLDEITIPELAILKDLTVADLGNNPIDCSDASFYGLVEWLVKQGVAPSYIRGSQIVVANSQEVTDDSLRVRWTAVYNSLCGDHAYEEKAAAIKKMAVPDVFPTLKDAYSYEDDDQDGSEDGDDEDDVFTNPKTSVTNDDDLDDDDDIDDDVDDDEDDSDTYIDVNKLSLASRGRYPLWPTLLISGSVFVMVVSLALLVTAVRRRHERERRNRFKAPMFRNLGSIPPQHKFAAIPTTLSRTRKDGGFAYKKLYEETTTPNVAPTAPFIVRSPDCERV